MKRSMLKNRLILVISIDRLERLADKPEWNKTPLAKKALHDVIEKRVRMLGELPC